MPLRAETLNLLKELERSSHRPLERISERLRLEREIAQEAARIIGRPVPPEWIVVDVPERLSFDVEIPEDVVLPTLTTPNGSVGMFFELVCESAECDEIAFLFFADARGYLAGVDITCGVGNHGPLPESVVITRVLHAL